MDFLNALKTQALANPLAVVSTVSVIVGTYKTYQLVNAFADSMYDLATTMNDGLDVPRRADYRRYSGRNH